jgi:hypothetical protein
MFVLVAIEEAQAAALSQQSTTLSLALSTPDTVVDVIVQRVDQTLTCDGARCTDTLRNDHAHAVTRKEGLRRILTTLSVCHPFGTHTHLLPQFSSHSTDF